MSLVSMESEDLLQRIEQKRVWKMKLDRNKEINRLLIYFFYDADGVVDRYASYMLEEMSAYCSETVVVCNGALNSKGHEAFQAITSNILVRENKGFDVWAYKAVIDSYGWEKLEKYDEIIMMNHTIMGPVYPFSEMFEKMDQEDVDFWGITKFHRNSANPFGIVYGYIPEHIQSHFIAVRKHMVASREFQNYWNTRPPIESYNDAVGKHEAVFTKHFSDIGFKWKVYIDTSAMEGFTSYPLFSCPEILLEKYRCPIFKRRNFFHEYGFEIKSSSGCQAKKIMDFLHTQTFYDERMIWENILRCSNMTDIKERLNLNYVLPSGAKRSVLQRIPKVALALHIYYDDQIDYCAAYADSMPEYADIYITTDTEKKKEKIQRTFENRKWNNVVVITIENRGRDVSSLLIGLAKYLGKYDYVCFAHDKKVPHLKDGIVGYHFSERCFSNVLGTSILVENIISLFEQQLCLGILCPPPANHSVYLANVGRQWGPNFEITKMLCERLGLSVPISEEKEPVAPLGTMFWFRPCALKKVLDYGWKYDDFPKEPIEIDGTILHGIERLYPFVAQDAGYYTAWVLSDDYARTELTNLEFLLRMQMKEANAEPEGLRMALKRAVKKRMPRRIWLIIRKVYRSLGGEKWRG